MKDCIIVTSIVEIGNAPMDWVSTRSIYSHKERFEQTLETIESIRKYMANIDILIECSPKSEYMIELEKRVNIFVNTYPNDIVRNCFNKSIGEATLIIKALDIIEKMSYNHIYKMTGRYVLTEKFNKNNWSDELVNGCLTDIYSSSNNPNICIHTFFYKIPMSYVSVFKQSLKTFASENTLLPVEHFVYKVFEKTFKNIPEIGIKVRWSCFDSQYET